MAKIRKKCGTCGSTDVVQDAWAEWSEEHQQWDLQNTFDNSYCNTCEGECSIEDEEIS